MIIKFRTIDIHAHILYGFDDGPTSREEASSIVKDAISQGVKAIISTPHYSGHIVNSNPLTCQLDTIRGINELLGNDFSIFTGNEVMWHSELPDQILKGEVLTLASSKYVLVEFAETEIYSTIAYAVRSLENYGYIPIIAHMERYRCLREADRIRDLKNMRAYLQMNFDSISGGIFNKDKHWCRKQVKDGNVDFLATDMHRIDLRPPNIYPAARWLQRNLEISEIERITYNNPLNIINSNQTT